GAGLHRGGCGYEKHIRMLRDAHFMSIADRSILACWGVNGGRAGRPFQVTIDPGGPAEREVDALADAEPVRAGEVVRIRTTGGGGWGDPLERDPGLVVRDVRWCKVSPEAALRDYGVVLTGSGDDRAYDDASPAARRTPTWTWSDPAQTRCRDPPAPASVRAVSRSRRSLGTGTSLIAPT